ncbi:hypothetical protein Pelo_7836 [Pelomyxa schiedti]|nr:hypothetical protein Pelo_7836 [Pelomyxa schiedti]
MSEECACGFGDVGSGLRVGCNDTDGVDVRGPTVTIECWVYLSAEQTTPYPVYVLKSTESRDCGFGLLGKSATGICLCINRFTDEALASEAILPVGEWHHVCGVFDRGQITMYVDGKQISQVRRPMNLLPASSPLEIGSTEWRIGKRGFVGCVKHLRLWRCARTLPQITSSMSMHFPTDQLELVLYLPLISSARGNSLSRDLGPRGLSVTPVGNPLMGRYTSAGFVGCGVVSTTCLVTGKAMSLVNNACGLVIRNCSAICPSGSFTLECWLNLRDYTAYPVYISKTTEDWNLGYGLIGKSNAGVTFFVNNWTHTIDKDAPLVKNVWHHLCGVYDSSAEQLSFYINGRLAWKAAENLPTPCSDDLRIGNTMWSVVSSVKYGFCGYMRDVRLWSCPRSQEQVAASMHRLFPSDRKNLELWLPLGSNGFSTASPEFFKDRGPNALSVEMVGGPLCFTTVVPFTGVEWAIARLLFIGKFKNADEDCPLKHLPLNVIHLIMSFL